MTDPEFIQKKQADLEQQSNLTPAVHSIYIQILIGAISFIVTLTILILVSFPVPELITAWVSSRNTLTPLPSTVTPFPTKTSTIALTPTSTPTITPTSLPPSSYRIADLSQLTPVVPSLITNAVVLNEDTSVTAVPAFDDIQWTQSSVISEQIGVELPEPYHATFGPGSATWVMDLPLDPGLYEIYLLDTLYSSGGVLEYTVSLGEETLSPLVGSTKLEYRSSRGNPPQRSDVWRSIGIFDIYRPDILSVSTSWELRGEQTIVAIDRLMIARVPDSLHALLDVLPKGQLIYIIDDSEAELEGLQYWQLIEEGPAWGDQYHLLLNPPIAVKAIWELPDPIPSGKYEVLAWIPKINGTASVNYKLLVEGSEITSTGEITPLTEQGDELDPHWQSLGYWQVPEIFEDNVQLTLELDVEPETIGETAVDAVAFILVP